jgi:CIC family chloride channel protein
MIWFFGNKVGVAGQGLGLLGGGYGAVQMAITGADWLPSGWAATELLLALAFAKLCVSALTIGSEGSAGDFAPSLAIGGLLGGAFGRAAAILFPTGQIQPAAFALVGMGVFYGGIAHVPLSALILVCELAGNYDLLVPLMLALGISFVAMRRVSLYESQVATQADSPVHRNALLLEALRAVRVRDVLPPPRAFRTFAPNTQAIQMLGVIAEVEHQEVFPVVDANGKLAGLVMAAALRVIAVENEGAKWLLAADVMQPPVSVTLDNDLGAATERMLSNSLREIPVTDSTGLVLALLDEMDIAQWHVNAAATSQRTPLPTSRPSWEIPVR